MKRAPYPTAYVARVAGKGSSAKSAVLVPRQLGWLSVKVSFHRQPTVGLEVKFFTATDEGEKDAELAPATKTDERGIARLDHMVPAGLYVCEIERQDPKLVSTVADDERPFPVPLPVGRAYYDVDELPEFDHDVSID